MKRIFILLTIMILCMGCEGEKEYLETRLLDPKMCIDSVGMVNIILRYQVTMSNGVIIEYCDTLEYEPNKNMDVSLLHNLIDSLKSDNVMLYGRIGESNEAMSWGVNTIKWYKSKCEKDSILIDSLKSECDK